MKNLLIFILILFSSTYAQQKIGSNELENTIAEVKEKYAPDKRTAIFEIEVKKNGDEITMYGETNLPEAKDELLDQLHAKNFNLKDSIKLLPDEELGEKIYGIVRLSVANIRSMPSHPAELATQSLLGTPLKIFKKRRGWYLVQTPDKYIAWVDDAGITEVTKEQIDEWINSEKVIVLADYTFAYSNPSTDSQRVSDLVAGDILKNLGEERNFCKVEFPDGRIGYIQKEECKVLNNWISGLSPDENSIVNTAKRYMGLPYLWGGTSTKGFDCSGFTKTVYYLNGIILQRDASQQTLYGELVDTENGFENLRPGDLLFFGRKATEDQKERVTHVGIYIGNNEFIHSAGIVGINSFDKDKPNFSEYRLNSFIRARRILNSIDGKGISTISSNKFYSGELDESK